MSGLYRGLTTALGPAIDIYLRRRLRHGKEDRSRFTERLGRADRPRPSGGLIWLHAASVGETISVLPLVERLLDERTDLHLLLTTGTVTSAAIAAERLPPRACHQYVPVDRPDAVERFLDHWRPDLGIWVESELWPNLISESHRRGMPLALINARMSARSYRKWRLLPFAIRPLLAAFQLCLAQSSVDATRLRNLGMDSVDFVGNLKAAAPPLDVDPTALAPLRAATGKRSCWLAACTHPGEETIVAAVHGALQARLPGLLTVLVPRHAERGAAVAEDLRATGLTVARRSRDELPSMQTQVYLGDSMGEMGLYYRLAPVVFIGGSLVPHGGQNPLEAARLDSALLFGPHMSNFGDAVDALFAADAAHQVRDAADLTEGVAGLLTNPKLLTRRATAAARVAGDSADVVGRVLQRLQPLLPRAA